MSSQEIKGQAELYWNVVKVNSLHRNYFKIVDGKFTRYSGKLISIRTRVWEFGKYTIKVCPKILSGESYPRYRRPWEYF
jgi:hypothetical protein